MYGRTGNGKSRGRHQFIRHFSNLDGQQRIRRVVDLAPIERSIGSLGIEQVAFHEEMLERAWKGFGERAFLHIDDHLTADRGPHAV